MTLYDGLEKPQSNTEIYLDLSRHYHVLHLRDKEDMLLGFDTLPETETEYREQNELSVVTRVALQAKYQLNQAEFSQIEEFFSSAGFMRDELLEHTVQMYNNEIQLTAEQALEEKFLDLITRATFWVDMFYFGSDLGPHKHGPAVASEPELLAAMRVLTPKQIARTGFKRMIQVLDAVYKV